MRSANVSVGPLYRAAHANLLQLSIQPYSPVKAIKVYTALVLRVNSEQSLRKPQLCSDSMGSWSHSTNSAL